MSDEKKENQKHAEEVGRQIADILLKHERAVEILRMAENSLRAMSSCAKEVLSYHRQIRVGGEDCSEEDLENARFFLKLGKRIMELSLKFNKEYKDCLGEREKCFEDIVAIFQDVVPRRKKGEELVGPVLVKEAAYYKFQQAYKEFEAAKELEDAN